MKSLLDKIVLISGGSGAVGTASAKVLLDKGATVFLTDKISPDSWLLKQPNVFFRAADTTDLQAVQKTYQAAVERFGRIDAAVLAAGIEGKVSTIEEISEADLDAILSVNLKGSLFWIQCCLQGMKAQGFGSIVALSSISGVVASALLGGYVISKHAVIGLVKAAALEAGPFGVRVNAVCPGPINSEMMNRLDKAFFEHNPNRFVGQSDAIKSIPTQRYVTAVEVGSMVAFLCGDESGSCNGGSFMLDGGFTIR